MPGWVSWIHYVYLIRNFSVKYDMGQFEGLVETNVPLPIWCNLSTRACIQFPSPYLKKYFGARQRILKSKEFWLLKLQLLMQKSNVSLWNCAFIPLPPKQNWHACHTTATIACFTAIIFTFTTGLFSFVVVVVGGYAFYVLRKTAFI